MTTRMKRIHKPEYPKGVRFTARKIAHDTQQRKLRYKKFETLWTLALDAGIKAGDAHTPTPMIVQGFENAPITSGVCGFASIHLASGRSSFAHWAKKHAGFTKDYRKGLSLWVSRYGQSMERKAAFAGAVAKILNENGIDAYSTSRMD